MFLLTSKERIKVLYGTNPGIKTDQRDEQFDQLIPQISVQIEKQIGAGFEAGSHSKVFNVADGQRVFILDGMPVTAITEVKSVVGSTETVLSASDFKFTERGVLYLNTFVAPGFQTLEVTFASGFADLDALIAKWPDLTLACEVQVMHIITRAPHLGAVSLSLAGGSRSFEQPVKLLPQVLELIAPFIRGY